MSVLPIVERELALASRRPSSYRVRWWAALLTAALTVGMLAVHRGSTARLGGQLFGMLTTLAFIYALLSGVRCTADALSREKREGTLGLLFLTDLRGYDIVLGKLAAHSLEAAYVLIAVLPLLGVPLVLGCVTGSEFWRMSLLLMNTLFLSLALGLLVSAVCQAERLVLLGTFFSLLFLTLGLPLIWSLLVRLLNQRWLDWLFLFPSPAYAFRMVSDGALRLANREYWLSMSTILGTALSALMLSSYLLPRVFQEKVETKLPHPLSELFRRWRFRSLGDSEGLEQREFRPFLWLVSRDRLPVVLLYVYSGVTVIFGCWAALVIRNPTAASRVSIPIAIFGLFGLHLIYKFLITAEASRRLGADKRSGALELLLVTPLPVASIFQGQLQSLRRQFLAPFLALALANYLFWLSTKLRHDQFPGMLGGILMAALDFYALSWVGMLTAMREKSYARAVFQAVIAVMAVPWGVFLVLIFGANSRGMSSSQVNNCLFWWFVAGAIYDRFLWGWAKTQVVRNLRRFAARDMPRSAPSSEAELMPAGLAARNGVRGATF